MDPQLSQPPRPSGGRISKLFTRGKVVSFGQDQDGDVLAWIQALTRTQHEEAALAAGMVAARRRLTYKPGNDDYDLLVQQIDEEATDEELVIGIIAAKWDHVLWAEAESDLHTQSSWRENGRLDLIRMGDAQVKSGAQISDEEAAALVELNQEYHVDWRQYYDARLATKKAELAELPREDLKQQYIEAALAIRIMAEQTREYNVVSTFYALRPCSATFKPSDIDGVPTIYDHSACGGHRLTYFTDMADVRVAPDEVIDKVMETLADLDSAADALGG